MSKSYTGHPSMSFMPLRNVEFSVVKEIKITIPKEGSYHDLNPEVFSETSGEFNVFADDVLYVPSITKVMIACNKYPALQGNQLFTPSYILVNEDTVEIQGSILEITKSI